MTLELLAQRLNQLSYSTVHSVFFALMYFF